MGELLICNQPIAALPYFIDGICWNVYSLEELCFYIENNTYLLERDFMTEELCTWVGKEIKNEKLAEHLRDISRMDGRLSEFVAAILLECGYCTKDKTTEIIGIIRDLEEKSDFECNKVRADRLMEKEKYLSSIYEYKSLLDSEEAALQPPELIGNIWHNLGTAHAGMFLFGEAIHCYKKAYALNQNEESLKECLIAYRCMKDEEGFLETARANGYNEEQIQALRTEIATKSRNEQTVEFENKLEALAMLNNSGQKAEYQKAISNLIFEWKEEYRRICRI